MFRHAPTAPRAERTSNSTHDQSTLGAASGNASLGTKRPLLKRAETAKLLGCSVSKIRRLEGTVLTPIVDPNGVHLFRAEEVETIRRVRVETETPADYDGAMAARVFALLGEGLHPVEIVQQEDLDPRAVVAIHDQWAAMHGGFVVYQRHLVELEMLPWLQAGYPMRSADELIDALKVSGSGELCRECARRPADLCGSCVQQLSSAEKAATKLIEDRERAAEGRRRRQIERSYDRDRAPTRRAKRTSSEAGTRSGERAPERREGLPAGAPPQGVGAATRA